MLFDLTGRGRRRTVRIVYTGLALLFAVSFVGFGVGTSGGGGFIEALFGKGGSSSGVSYSSQLKTARRLSAAQPANPNAWTGLIHTALLQTTTEGNYVTNGVEGAFTPKARPLLLEVQSAWRRYLKLTPHNPSANVAREVMRVYATPGGLSEPQQALKTWQIVVAGSPPEAGLYSQLAVYAYQANNKPLGDRASKKAIKLAPAGERTLIENTLAKAKSTPNLGAEGAAGATAGKTAGAPAPTAPRGTSTTPAKPAKK
jgi:hypothetical protein